MIPVRKLGFSLQVGAVVGLVYLAGLGSPSAPQAQGRGNASADTPDAQYVTGEVLIQYRFGASEAAKQRARGRAAAQAEEVLVRAANRIWCRSTSP